MKIAVSVFGRLHAYYLAEQLHQRQALERLYTTYPKYEVEKYGIPRSLTTSWPALELAFRGYLRLPAHLRGDDRMLLRFPAVHDRLVSRLLQGGIDVFHGWSQMSELSLARAQALGATATLQRGSSHIRYQRDILREEYERWGTTGELPHSNVVEREEREYEIADFVFVPSEFARQTFLSHGIPSDKVVKVPLGVSLKQFYPVPKQDDVFRVMYAGTLSLRKGVQYLLQAFSELRLPLAELWLVGQALPEIQPLFRRYEGHFQHLGKVPQAQLRDLYGQCSVFTLPSIEDGFGVVLTQAMACGLPVICSTNTGGPDVLTEGEEGFIVPIRDVPALKERILFLYEQRDACRIMGQRAQARAQSALSWDDYGHRIFDIFNELVAAKQQRSRPGVSGGDDWIN